MELRLGAHTSIIGGYTSALQSIHSDEPVGRTSKIFNRGNIKDTFKGFFNRPDATVRVGEPRYLEKIDPENFARFQEILAKDASQRTQEEADFRKCYSCLNNDYSSDSEHNRMISLRGKEE